MPTPSVLSDQFTWGLFYILYLYCCRYKISHFSQWQIQFSFHPISTSRPESDAASLCFTLDSTLSRWFNLLINSSAQCQIELNSSSIELEQCRWGWMGCRGLWLAVRWEKVWILWLFTYGRQPFILNPRGGFKHLIKHIVFVLHMLDGEQATFFLSLNAG